MLDSLINDLLNSVSEGYTWGIAVSIGFVSMLMAISVISYLFNRNL